MRSESRYLSWVKGITLASFWHYNSLLCMFKPQKLTLFIFATSINLLQECDLLLKEYFKWLSEVLGWLLTIWSEENLVTTWFEHLPCSNICTCTSICSINNCPSSTIKALLFSIICESLAITWLNDWAKPASPSLLRFAAFKFVVSKIYSTFGIRSIGMITSWLCLFETKSWRIIMSSSISKMLLHLLRANLPASISLFSSRLRPLIKPYFLVLGDFILSKNL